MKYIETGNSKGVSVQGLTYAVGEKMLFDEANFYGSAGDTITIVGENGVGKSTFLKILKGDIGGFEGVIKVPEAIAYLHQSFESFNSLIGIERFIQLSNRQDWKECFLKFNQQQNNEWLDEFTAMGGYQVLTDFSHLGLDDNLLFRPLSGMSGGEKTKLHLCALFYQQPQLLLLDEPTNHLDIRGIEWLEQKLKYFDGTIIMISHDRSLINNTSNKISELSPITHDFVHFKGGYNYYLLEQEKIRKRLIEKREKQEFELSALSQRVLRSHQVKRSDKKRKDGDKLGYNARGHRQQKSQGRELNSLKTKKDELQNNLVPILQRRKDIDIRLVENVIENRFSIKAENVSFEFSHCKLLSNLDLFLQQGESLCITGPNGSGKTTFLKILAKELTPTSGSVSYFGALKMGFLDQQQELIDLSLTAPELIKSKTPDINDTEVFRLLKKFGIINRCDLNSPLSLLSIGTRRKAQLSSIVASGANTLFLDEPTNHLDIMSIEQIEKELRNFPGIIVAVTHDRYFIKKLEAKTLKIGIG